MTQGRCLKKIPCERADGDMLDLEIRVDRCKGLEQRGKKQGSLLLRLGVMIEFQAVPFCDTSGMGYPSVKSTQHVKCRLAKHELAASTTN